MATPSFAPRSLSTYAVVATLVLLSGTAMLPWVVARVPFGRVDTADRNAAEPDVLAALLGMSPETSAGSCACGSVPVVRFDALITTFALSAWPFTVVLVATLPPSSDVSVAVSTATLAAVRGIAAPFKDATMSCVSRSPRMFSTAPFRIGLTVVGRDALSMFSVTWSPFRVRAPSNLHPVTVTVQTTPLLLFVTIRSWPVTAFTIPRHATAVASNSRAFPASTSQYATCAVPPCSAAPSSKSIFRNFTTSSTPLARMSTGPVISMSVNSSRDVAGGAPPRARRSMYMPVPPERVTNDTPPTAPTTGPKLGSIPTTLFGAGTATSSCVATGVSDATMTKGFSRTAEGSAWLPALR